MLEFNVKNQIIARTDAFRVVADSRNYLTARFTFTEEWKGDIIAIFGNGEEYYNVVLSDNTCTVPWEVIKPPFFTVSVFCGEESLVTANVLTVEVEKSGMEEGKTPTTPTPDVWQQYMASMQKMIDKGLPYIGDSGNWFLYDAKTGIYKDTGISAIGPKGDTGATGASGQRGTGVLKVTTPTTSASGTGPTGTEIKYKIALSAVKSEAGVDEVLIGDTVLRSYYMYPVENVDASYVYLGAYTNIRGATGAAGSAGAKGDKGDKGDKGEKGDAFTYEDFTEEQLAGLKGEKGDAGYTLQWKKIVDITTTEEVNGIIVTNEEYPDISKCKEFIVRGILPVSPTGSTITLGTTICYINSDSCVGFRVSSTAANLRNVTEHRGHMIIADGLVYSTCTNSTVAQSSLSNSTHTMIAENVLSEDVHTIIYQLETSENSFPIDTRLVIYGKVGEDTGEKQETYDSRITACEERLLANEKSISEMYDANTVPSYIQTEGERVANLLLNLRNSKSICFAALSDTHVGVGGDTKSAVIDTGKAIREIRKYLPLDFIGLFGDYVAGGSSSTISGSKEELKFVHKSLYEAGLGVQQIWMQGNHDRNPYDTDDGDLTDEELYSYIFSNNTGAIIDKDNVQRGYGYKDFENQKVRVIYWNTSDISEAKTLSDHMISASQYEWMGNVAFNLSDKEDAQEWGIIMLSHMPVNWNAQLTNFVDAYISGESVTLTAADNISVTIDFSGKNEAEFICAINGHTHNYRYSQIGTNNFWQIAVPQVCAGRYNEYGTSYPEVGGELDSNGDPVYYYKTAETAKSTSFVVFVIDRKNKQIQAIHYGAGIDRVIKYGRDDESETPETPTYTNVVPISQCADSTEVYNGGLGYKDGYYISSTNGNESAKSGHTVTGFVPYSAKKPSTIYVKGGEPDRVAAYLEDKSFNQLIYASLTKTQLGTLYYSYTPVMLDDGTPSIYYNYGDVRYLRFDCICSGADLIITLDEPIE